MADSALAAIDGETPSEIVRQVKTTLANIGLDRAQEATTPEEVATLEDEAHGWAAEVLRILQDGSAESSDAEAMALAQTTLGRIMRFQASLTSGEQRSEMLTRVESILRDALHTLPEAAVETIQTRIWTESVLAETLLQHARQLGTASEAQRYLSEAETLARNVMGTLVSSSQPESLAWILGVCAGVLAQQAEVAENSRQEALLDEAWQYCLVALDVPNQQSAPEDWAGTRFTAAVVALRSARLLVKQDVGEGCALLESGKRFVDDALGMYSHPAYFNEFQQTLALRNEIKQAAVIMGCLA